MADRISPPAAPQESPVRRVLHVIDSLGLGGAERMAVELANAASQRGYAAGIVATRKDGPTEALLAPQVPRWILGRRSRLDLKWREFLRVCEGFRPDLLHVHGASSTGYVTAVKLRTGKRWPVVFHDHNGSVLFAPPKPLFGRLCRWAVSHVVAVSREKARWAVASGFPPARVTAIVNALDWQGVEAVPPRSLMELGLVDVERPIGLVVANLRYEKGILELLQAMALVPSPKPFTLLVAGGGTQTRYGKTCLERVRALGLQNKVRFVGPVPQAAGLMKSCDFGVVPSLIESGPLSLIEFLACGLPAVCTQVGEVAILAAEAGAVRAVPPGDPAALGREILRLVEMPEESRRQEGNQGRLKARGLFEMAEVFPRWEALYRQVVSECQTPK